MTADLIMSGLEAGETKEMSVVLWVFPLETTAVCSTEYIYSN